MSCSLEVWPGLVAIIHDGIGQWPRNPECWIIPPRAAAAVRGEELGHLVKYLGVIGQGLEAVREPLWDVEHSSSVFAQLNGDMLEARWRLEPEIHDDVEDCAARAAG